ncbi:MAG: hypothetical protein ACREUP_07780, partial [Burkholderiales bacterium]
MRALIGRLAEEFSVDSRTLARVVSVLNDVREQAPDLFIPAAGALDSAFARAKTPGGAEIEGIYAALGEWALDAEGEMLERMRRD